MSYTMTGELSYTMTGEFVRLSLPRPTAEQHTRPLRLFWRDDSSLRFFEQMKMMTKIATEMLLVAAICCALYRWIHDRDCWLEF